MAAITWRQLTSDVSGATNAAIRGMDRGRQNITDMLSGFRNQMQDHVDTRTAQNEADLRSYLNGFGTPEAFTQARESGAIQERINGYGEFAPEDRFQSLVSAYPGTLRDRITEEQSFTDAQDQRNREIALRPLMDKFNALRLQGDTKGMEELVLANDFGSQQGAMIEAIRKEQTRNKTRQGEESSRNYFAEINQPGAFNDQQALDGFINRVVRDRSLSTEDRDSIISMAQKRAADGSLGVVDERNLANYSQNLATSLEMGTNMYYQEGQNPDAFNDTLNSASGIKAELVKSGMSEDDATKFSAGLFEVVARGVSDGNGGRARLPMSPALIRMIKDQATDFWLKNDLTAAEAAEQAIASLGLADQYAAYNRYQDAVKQERSRLSVGSGRTPAQRFAQEMYNDPPAAASGTAEAPAVPPTPPATPVTQSTETSPVRSTDELISALRGVNESNISLTPEQESRADKWDSSWLRKKAGKEQMSEMRDLRGEYIELMQTLSNEVPPSFIEEARRGNNLGSTDGRSLGRSPSPVGGTKWKLDRMVELEQKLRSFVAQ